MASNITVDTLTKGSTTLNTDEIVDTNSNQICKAWVNFDQRTGALAIKNSYNVSSVTDNGTGDATINFSTAMANSNYAFTGSCNEAGGSSWGNQVNLLYAATTSSQRILTGYSNGWAINDCNRVEIAVFGD